MARASSATARAATQAIQVVRSEAPGWLGGAAAGVQGALFSYGLVLVPLWVVAAATSDSTVSWGQSTGIAARVWLLGFAVPWAVEGVPISLIPLGLPVLTALMLVQLARRFASATWTAGTTTVVAFAGTVAAICAMAWSASPDHGDRVVRAAIVAAAVAMPAVSWGLIRQQGAVLPWLERIPRALRAGTRVAIAMGGMLAVCSSLLAALSTIMHRHAIAASSTAMGPDTISGVALAFLETLYAPTVVVWSAAWLAGAGYSVGGTEHVPGLAVESATPVPMMGALPDGGGVAAWSPWLVVAVGAVAAFALRKRLGMGLTALAGIGVGVAGCAVAVGAVTRLSTGAMGPGLYAEVGPQPVVATVLVTAELAAGALLAATAWHAAAALYGTTTIKVRSASAPLPPVDQKPAGRTATEPRPRSDQTRPADNPRDTDSRAQL